MLPDDLKTNVAGSAAPTPGPTPTPTATQGSIPTTPITTSTPTPSAPPSSINAPYDPTKAGRRLIFRKATDELIRDTMIIIEREGLESFYRNSRPGANARTGRSDAGELRGRYIKELHERTVAIKNFIVEELGLSKDDYERDYVMFYDMSTEIVATEEVISKLKLRIGWLAEHSDFL